MRAALLLAFSLLLSAPARAVDLDLAAGTCQATAQHDGTLWQSEYEHHNEMTSPCYHIGLSGKFRASERRLGWTVFYADLGRWSINSVVKGDDQDRFVPNSGSMQRMTGDGGAYGIGFGITQENRIADLIVRPEVGLFAYRYWWYEVIVHPDSGENVFVNKSNIGLLTPYFGLTLKYADVFLASRYYLDVQGHRGVTGIANGPLWTFLVGTSIGF